MRYFPQYLFIIALLSTTGCAGSSAETQGNAAAGDTVAADQEWTTLFDGTSLEHWRGYQQDELPSAWRINDGALAYVPGEGEGGDIVTRQEFDNFELELEWRLAEGGNSGIMYRVKEDPDYSQTYHTGPEMQVLDNEGHSDGVHEKHRAGANYALNAPAVDAARPVGEWNSVRIVADGAHVEHWLNGEKVVEYEQWSDEWEQLVEESKFASEPGYGQYRSGRIALQDHGDPVWYRNIRIRELR